MICILKVIHSCWLMFLKIHEIGTEKFLSGPGLAQKTALKISKVKLKQLTNIGVLFDCLKRN